MNVVVGLLLPHMPGSVRQRTAIGGLTLAGMLMTLGILAEVVVGLPPILVIAGGVSILVGTLLAGIVWIRDQCLGSAASTEPEVLTEV